MSFRVPEQYRINPAHLPGRRSEPGDLWGCFLVPARMGSKFVPLRCIASNGDDWTAAGLPGCPWEHVSISAQPPVRRCPTWEEMCMVKALFWEPEDAVVQFHPPESEYVNNAPYCLHLWRPVGIDLVRPPSITVGTPRGPSPR